MMQETTSRQLTLDIEEEVWQHLLFHKSMIDDDKVDLYEKLDRYMEVLKDIDEGVHVTIKDSYSRSIAMIMELAIDEYLDPWDLDLTRFCRLFMKKVKNTQRMNLMVVGKIIRMAYEVLYMKSSNTLLKAEYVEHAEEPEEDLFFGWMEDDETFEGLRNILKNEEPPISESVIHKGDRPVTLVDLLNALENVEDEVQKKRVDRVNRVKAKSEMDRSQRANINRKMVRENVEEEIKMTWQRVNKFNGHPISFEKINSGFELDPTSTFLSLLFLAKWDRIRIWQRKFPHGEIFVKNTSPGEKLKFGELSENVNRVKRGSMSIPEGEELVVEKKEIPKNWNT